MSAPGFTMAAVPVYSLRCSCGSDVPFPDDARGYPVQCGCGKTYIAPLRDTWLDRFFGKLRWAQLTARLPRYGPVALGPARFTYRADALTRCPLCAAVARPEQRWQCEFCHCLWNTFATHGRCPGCNFRFPATVCLACDGMSRHDDWYAHEG